MFVIMKESQVDFFCDISFLFLQDDILIIFSSLVNCGGRQTPEELKRRRDAVMSSNRFQCETRVLEK